MSTKVGVVLDDMLDLDFSKVNGLLLTAAEKIPPHIGLVSNGFYYSATANGTILDRKMTSVLDVIIKKKKKVLFASFDFKLDEEIIRKTFLEYGALVNGKTCLHPARMCVEKSTGLEFKFVIYLPCCETKKTFPAMIPAIGLPVKAIAANPMAMPAVNLIIPFSKSEF